MNLHSKYITVSRQVIVGEILCNVKNGSMKNFEFSIYFAAVYVDFDVSHAIKLSTDVFYVNSKLPCHKFALINT